VFGDLVEDGEGYGRASPGMPRNLSVAINSGGQPELKQRMSTLAGTNSHLLTGSMRRWSGPRPRFRDTGLDEFRETAAVAWHRCWVWGWYCT